MSVYRKSRPTYPSLATGYARNAAESEYPELWRGLVGAWPIGMQNSSNNVYDLVNGANGSVDGAVWSRNPYGRALLFDGNNDIVPTTFDFDDFLIATDHQFFSVSCRFTHDGGANAGIMWASNRTYGLGAMIVNTGFGLQNNRFVLEHSITNFSWTSDSDSHAVTACWGDRTLAPKCYLDGDSLSITTDVGSVNPTPNDFFTIGGRGAKSVSWEGLLWDFVIHSRVLTPSEIQTLHEIPYAPFVKRRRFYAFGAAATGYGPLLSSRRNRLVIP